MNLADLAPVVPVLILAASAIVVAIIALPSRVGARPLAWSGAIACAAAAASAIAAGPAAPGGAVARDAASVFFSALVATVAAALLVLAAAEPRRPARSKDEAGLGLFAAAGAVLVVSAADLVVLFVGLALMTIPLSVLTARPASRVDDGASRHFVRRAAATAVALYGVALLYAATGETAYGGLGRATHNPLYLAGLGLALAGLASQLVIARGQRWSILVDVAIVGAVLRLVAATARGEIALDWQVSLAALAAIAVGLPAVAAIGERRVRRLAAYATCSQLGYVAVAAAAAGLPAAAFALAVSSALAVGLFAVIAILPAGEPTIEDLAGLARRRPLVVLALGLVVLGLIGLPPTIGFVARVYALEAAVRAQLLWLVFVGVLASVANATAYARLILGCLAPPPLAAVAPPRMRLGTAVALLAGVAILAAGLIPGPLLEAAQAVRF